MKWKSVGSLMIDLQGVELLPEEGELLAHPLVGGIILFSRNYTNPDQLRALCGSVREIKQNLFIMVDQEGGRVQRFRDGFTRLPPMATFGHLYQRAPLAACQSARECGWLMAQELLDVGITNSLAPVLDLYSPDSKAIGDRAFAADCESVVRLAKSFIKGMNEAGMVAVGKHFPGHGKIQGDSHFCIPHDARTLAELEQTDLKSFLSCMHDDLNILMVAHIIFEQIDSLPPTYSPKWLNNLLRKQYGFRGLVISDDLNMEGANISSSYYDRFMLARDAGCDVILLCNNRQAVIQIIDAIDPELHLLPEEKWQYLMPLEHRNTPYNTEQRRRQAKQMISEVAMLTEPTHM